MFVAINNVDMNINDVEKWIKGTRDASVDETITPEFAMEILSKTNHLGHIKKVLRNIYKNCTTPEKMAPYKEFILSCVDGREMSGEAYQTLQEMAKLCGCEEDLVEVNKNTKYYGVRDCENIATASSKEELEQLKGANLYVLFICKKSSPCELGHVNYKNIKRIRFSKGSQIKLCGGENFPEIIDASECEEFQMKRCRLNGVKELKGGGFTNFYDVKGIGERLDLSQATKVWIEHCPMSNVSELKFAKATEVRVGGWRHHGPKKIDFSQCDSVKPFEFSLRAEHFDGVEEIKFRDRAQLKEIFENVINLKLKPKVVYENETKLAKRARELFTSAR